MGGGVTEVYGVLRCMCGRDVIIIKWRVCRACVCVLCMTLARPFKAIGFRVCVCVLCDMYDPRQT